MDDNCTTGEGRRVYKMGPLCLATAYTHKKGTINLSVGAKKGANIEKNIFLKERSVLNLIICAISRISICEKTINPTGLAALNKKMFQKRQIAHGTSFIQFYLSNLSDSDGHPGSVKDISADKFSDEH